MSSYNYKLNSWVQMHDGQPVVHHRGGAPQGAPSTPEQQSLASKILGSESFKVGASIAVAILGARYLRPDLSKSGMFFGGVTTKRLAAEGRVVPERAMQIATRMHARGANEAQIWKRTGRFLERKGEKDFAAATVNSKGQPLIELDDSKMKLMWNPKSPKEFMSSLRGDRDAHTPSMKYYLDKWAPFEGMSVSELKKAAAKDPNAKNFLSKLQPSGIGTLGEYVHHPALYKVDPTLKAVKTNVTTGLPKDHASYSHDPIFGDVISIGGSRIMPTSRVMPGTVLHETQHRVQRVDGLPRGSNPAREVVSGKPSPEHTLRTLSRGFDRVAKLYPAEAKTLAAAKRSQGLSTNDRHRPMSIGLGDSMPPHIAKTLTDLVATRQGRLLFVIDDTMAHIARMRGKESRWVERHKFAGYWNKEGEKQARNVSARLGLTVQQRRARPPSATLDEHSRAMSWMVPISPRALPKSLPKKQD
jgi:hypothetical protein